MNTLLLLLGVLSFAFCLLMALALIQCRAERRAMLNKLLVFFWLVPLALWAQPPSTVQGWLQAAIPTAADPLKIGLMNYWTLNETSGTRYDSVGTNHLVDVYSNVTATNGVAGNAARFVTNRLAFTASDTSLSTTNVQTIQIWLKRYGTLGSYGYAFNVMNTNGAAHYLSLTPNGDATFVRAISGSYSDRTTMRRDYSGWMQIIWTSTNSTSKFYTNTVEAASVAMGAVQYRGQITVGNYNGGSNAGNVWVGEIDEIGWWNRVLTTAEIAELYNSGNGKALF